MTHDTTQDPSINRQGLPHPPTLEIADYQGDLAALEFSPEQEREVLEYLWHMVKTIVDAGYGLDAASTVLSAITREVFDGHSISDDDEAKSERKDP